MRGLWLTMLGFFLPAVTLPAAELTLAWTPRWRGAEIVGPTMVLANAHGQALRVTRLAWLVSGVGLLRTDGTVVRLDGQAGFIDALAGRRAMTLRNVPAGSYAGLQFEIGLSPELNHGDPGRWPAGHPLNPLVNGLHWSWKGGYVFLALEGRWQDAGASAAAGAGGRGEERGFSYHLAGDGQRMTGRFLAEFEVKTATRIELALELAKVLGELRLDAGDGSESTHSAAGDTLAPRLAAAVGRSFFWLGASEVGNAGDAGGSAEAGDRAPYFGGTPWAFQVPAGFPQPALPADNPLSVEGVALGETLFHDRRLSGNGTQSCASCHDPARSFSDRVALSRGADGRTGERNAMALVNLAWQPAFAWDGGQRRVRDQALAAMTNPREMHGDPARVVAALVGDAAIRARFEAVFGDGGVTAERIGRALEQFLLVQVSADAKFDRAQRGQAELTEEEKEGFALFMTEYDPVRGRRGADCFHCHGGALFSDFGYKSNGLDAVSVDRGRGRVTGRGEDEGKFKTPSLRNVALTAPYMHDGRLATLEEVVAHYDHGVRRGAALDPNLAKHPAEGLGLTAAEQRALVAFLRTLTDERFADPRSG